ncbi:MAG: chemotaxis protein CheA [Archaeoglobales archaeon]|nr:chemotaxis protein CheA [Archaeoglobales archaeon]
MNEFGEMLQEFIHEAREYLDAMNQELLNLERGDFDAVNEVFRAVHTIKGMAGFMGFKNLENLCHKLENLLGEIRDEKIEINSDLVDILLKAVDKIAEIINLIENNKKDEIDISDILSSLESWKKSCKENKTSENQNLNLDADFVVDIKIADDCLMKSVRAALVIESLKEFCKVVSVVPSEEEMDSTNFNGKFSILAKGDCSKIDEVLERIAEIDSYSIKPLSTREQTKEPKKDSNVIEEDKLKIEKVETREKEEDKEAIPEKKKSESVRVNVSQLDKIMNLVGELVIGKGRLLQIASQYDIAELKEAVSILDRAITNLQDEVMRIRMVKVERVFNRFPRMVRDLARKLGKKVEFTMEGLDTELDRTVLDEMTDPLIHLLRNAIDHGIESPEERKALGKNEVGKIKISAKRERNNIVIEIEDDGRGIDLEKVKKKAIEKGLISESSAASLSNEDLISLIFLPGFSTKDTASEISGRGVGMDVVKTTVEKLGGSLKVATKKGEGTKIRIQLPPTIAIIKALLVNVSNETYAIPISSVVEALYVDSTNYKVIHGNPFIIVRDKLVPAFKIKEIFGIRNGKMEREVGIVVEKNGEKYALIVDSISEQQEIVIKPLTGYLSKVKGFNGITILGDGRVVPILDISSLIGGDNF